MKIVVLLGPYCSNDRLLKQMAGFVRSKRAYPIPLAACERGSEGQIRMSKAIEFSCEFLKRLDPKQDAVFCLDASARSTPEVQRAEELGLKVFWGPKPLEEWLKNAD